MCGICGVAIPGGVSLVVEGRLDEVGGQVALALDVRHAPALAGVAGVHEDLGGLLGDLDAAHDPAGVHAGRHVHGVAPDVVLGLLGAHDARDHGTVVQTWKVSQCLLGLVEGYFDRTSHLSDFLRIPLRVEINIWVDC